jgi:hypothetical protein
MGFFPFFPQSVPVAGGTFTGPVTIAGLLTTQAGITNSGANISSANNIQSTGVATVIGGGGLNAGVGQVDVPQMGQGLAVKEGANAKQGTFVLSGAATTTVANTSVTANSRILLTTQALGTVTSASTLAVSSRVAGTSFTVTPSQATDTSTIAFEIVEPG